MISERKRLQFSKYVILADYTKIIKLAEINCPEISPNIILSYNFSLRISETLGLTKSKFLKDSLLVDEQGDKIENGEIIRKATKTNERRVP